MTTIKINAAARTLEMPKTFAAKAYTFGTREYDMLQKARKDYPDFEVVVKAHANTKTINKFEGLALEVMEKHIAECADEEKKASALESYRTLRGIDENGNKIYESENFQTIKAWFLMEFPELENFGKKYDEMMEKRKALKKQLEERRKAVA